MDTKKTEKEPILKRIIGNTWARIAGVVILVAIAVAGAIILKSINSSVYTDQADIEAPTIILSPTTPGTLQQIFVNVGDHVAANTPVAQVGNQITQAQVAGIITSTGDTIGQIANPGDPVVTMIDPTQLRAVAHLDEDKGLSDVQVGQHAVFTVDAFGSQTGVRDYLEPDLISATARYWSRYCAGRYAEAFEAIRDRAGGLPGHVAVATAATTGRIR